MHLLLSHAGLLAATFTWDPFIRGVVITALFVVLLPGSVYLVLSTDVGGRLGFLLMAAGMSGMLCLLSLLWMPLASTADIGRPNSWKPLEVITGDYASQVTPGGAKDLPIGNLAGVKPPVKDLSTKHWYWPLQSCSDSGWHKIDPSLINDPESEADKILANTSGALVGPTLTSPYTAASDYVYIDGFQKGENGGCLFAVSRHKIYVPLARGAHYVVLRVLPSLPVLSLGGAPPAAQPDRSKPYTYVILVRNLGSVRQPQAMLSISMGITFLVICYILHTRDKEKEAADAAAAAGDSGGGGAGPGGTGGPGGAGPEREKVGAGV
ncbi:MAG: hypothetical protein QOF30_3618 [Acidimicrobiaceae bacterium]|nr:hypothetical protein [Acidimicrobiaceae bacterium]